VPCDDLELQRLAGGGCPRDVNSGGNPAVKPPKEGFRDLLKRTGDDDPPGGDSPYKMLVDVIRRSGVQNNGISADAFELERRRLDVIERLLGVGASIVEPTDEIRDEVVAKAGRVLLDVPPDDHGSDSNSQDSV